MPLLKIVLLSITALESLASVFLNVFIVLFHMRSLRNGVKLNPSNLIQMIMGVINISMRGMLLWVTIVLWFPVYRIPILYQIITIMVPFHFSFSYWLIAWLCTYYCTAIANIRHRVFMWVKRRLVSFLPHLLLLSAVVSLALTFQLLSYINFGTLKDNSSLSYTLGSFEYSISNPNLMCIYSLSFLLPCLPTLCSLVVTTSSLCSHIWKMKRNGSGFAPPNLQVHVRAVTTMMLFLLLSTSIKVAEILKIVAASFFAKYVQLIIWIMVSTFPLAEAAIIVQSSRELKTMFSRTFCAGRFTRDDH